MDDLRAIVTAYGEAFADRTALRTVLDDMQTAISAMPIEHQAGAWRLYGHIQLRTSALRREQRRDKKGATKT